MNNASPEIIFDCPKCNRPMSGGRSLLGEMISCPACSEPFIPTPRRTEPLLQGGIKLIRCPACGLQISPRASSCPSCAHPIRAEENRDRFAGRIIMVVLLVVFAIAFLLWTFHKMDSDKRDADRISQQEMDNSR